MNEFKDRLRKLREKERPVISMRVKSELIGLGSDSLRRYERGEREPKLTELKKIANHYHVSLDSVGTKESKNQNFKHIAIIFYKRLRLEASYTKYMRQWEHGGIPCAPYLFLLLPAPVGKCK